jgi:dihydrofolate reductase
MRKIILYIAPSLDGYIARRDGSIDWLRKYETGEEDYGYNEFLKSVDTLLMGRKTYEQIVGFGEWPYEGKQGYVFSTQGIRDPRVMAVPEPVTFTKALKEKPGKDIWLVGGGQAISLLMNHRLVDEIIITIIPIILGSGIPLFSHITAETKCVLIKEKAYPSGLVQLHYSLTSH